MAREQGPRPSAPIGRPAARFLTLGLGLIAGCAAPAVHGPEPLAPVDSFAASRVSPAPRKAVGSTGPVVPAGGQQEPPTVGADVPFAGATELSEDDLVREVLRRNPTVAQMAAAARAAAARFPQVTSLEDPRAGAFVGPASIGSRDVEFAYRLEVSQMFPYPGKLALRGEAARNEAAAAGAELDDARVMLTEAARGAFADYYLAARSAEVNEEGLKLLQEFRENAANRYRTGQGQQQDVLQADVTIARQRERASTVERLRRVAQARINTLLNLLPDAPLPGPPKTLGPSGPLPSVAELREVAVRQRPDVAALRARMAADEAAVALALQEYKPDFEAMAAYDAFWQPRERDLRPMVGVRVNLPTRLDRRNAAVTEAQARLAQRRAELARLVAQINFQVQEAYEQAAETERSLRLYDESALPAARENVRLAQAGYAVARIPFLNLVEAQRALVELRDRQFELLAEARRRRAALDRAVGAGMPVPPEAGPAVTPPASPALPKPREGASAAPGGPSTPSPDSKGPGR